MSISTATTPIWEYRDISFPLGTSRERVRQIMTSLAGSERWELQVAVQYPDGRQRARFRRKVYRFTRMT
jgi:hypothetical protein